MKNAVSIPFSTIKSFTAKAGETIPVVSIPFSTIKRPATYCEASPLVIVSIPFSTIKSFNPLPLSRRCIMFQFHLVRLKAHKVLFRQRKGRSFNSI